MHVSIKVKAVRLEAIALRTLSYSCCIDAFTPPWQPRGFAHQHQEWILWVSALRLQQGVGQLLKASAKVNWGQKGQWYISDRQRWGQSTSVGWFMGLNRRHD